MLHRINIKKLREDSENARLFLLDVVMIVLAFLYLAWTLLDILLRTNVLTQLIQLSHLEWVVEGHKLYVSFDSIFYDTIFVSIFLAELFFRWGLAIYRNTYHRWFFYPFVHWYDTLGCIPVTSFKFFRVLRIFFVGHRLHQIGVVNLSGTFIYEVLRKYSGVIIEEISDRVVINIITGMQLEMDKGTSVADRVIQEVIEPHKAELVTWLAHRIQYVAGYTHELYANDIQAYVDNVIEEAVHKNKEIANIERIPLVGNTVGVMLESAISDIVNQVISRALRDLASSHNKGVVNGVADAAIEAALFHEDDAKLDQIVSSLVSRSLEMLKEHVKIQQWKEEEKSKPI